MALTTSRPAATTDGISIGCIHVGISFIGIYYAYFVESKQGGDPGTVRLTNVQDVLNVIDYTARDSLTVTSAVLSSRLCIID
jgi:hypothetical protein